MPLRRLLPAILMVTTSTTCIASTTVTGLRATSLKLSQDVREHNNWGSAARASQFASIPHTSSRVGCEATRLPQALATPDPLWDKRNLGSRISVSFIIGTDGKVHSPFILESAGASEDRAVLGTVRSWRYRPAMCNGMPTESEAKIEFSSR